MGWSQVETFLRVLDPKTGAAVGSAMSTVNSLPQTQAQVAQIASLAKQAQDPNLQAEIKNVAGQAEIAAKTMLTLQALSTAFMGGMLVIAYLNYRKGR
jgi:hypothetical protein